MKPNYPSVEYHSHPRSVSAQARLLMSEHRQKLQNRQQSMLHRAALSVGIEA
ncbi:MAG: hypothetical protein KME08_02460 [Aphanothece sp. CMT-3BRIN-NPC111]|nr:hypothetical protein [Aphanothece sp. CMT-3BRIN-NPC111]